LYSWVCELQIELRVGPASTLAGVAPKPQPTSCLYVEARLTAVEVRLSFPVRGGRQFAVGDAIASIEVSA
jgi:hypothetical protein